MASSVNEAQHLKFFKGVRADLQKRYTLQNHIGRGACAPLPSPCRRLSCRE